MGWLRRLLGRSGEPEELAERLSGRNPFRIGRDVAALHDRDTVRRWLREQRADRDQILVHRSWGTVAAVGDRRHPVGIVMSDGNRSWHAVPPGAPDGQELTAEQVEHVMLDALSSPAPPEWAEWRRLL